MPAVHKRDDPRGAECPYEADAAAHGDSCGPTGASREERCGISDAVLEAPTVVALGLDDVAVVSEAISSAVVIREAAALGHEHGRADGIGIDVGVHSLNSGIFIDRP